MQYTNYTACVLNNWHNHYKKYLVALIIISIAACTKIEQPLLQPNTIKEDDEVVTDKELLRIIERLEKNDIHTKRLKSVIASYRKPHWNKSLFKYNKIITQARGTQSGNGADTIVYVPLSPPRQAEVKAYIKAVIHDSISLSLYMASDYKKYPYQDSTHNQQATGEKMAIKFMHLNESVYGYTKFKILDTNLFHKAINTASKSTRIHMVKLSQNSTANKKQYTGNCETTYNASFHCTKSGKCLEQGYCDWCGSCVTFTPSGIYCSGNWEEAPGGGGGSSGGTVGAPPAGTTGGGGGGGTGGVDPTTPAGWEPMPTEPTDPHEPPQDPCETAKEQAKRLDSVWTNANMDSAIQNTPDPATHPNEHGFGIKAEYRVHPFNVHDTTIIDYKTDAITPGSLTGVEIPLVRPRLYFILGTLHTHPKGSGNGNYAAPSGTDVFSLIGLYQDWPDQTNWLVGNFVHAFNGSQYALTVTNLAQAEAFGATKRDNLDDSTNGFKKDTQIGKLFQKAQEAFLRRFGNSPVGVQKSYEMAMAAALTIGNTGITLNKRNPVTKKFEPIRVSQQQNPSRPKKFTFEQDCL